MLDYEDKRKGLNYRSGSGGIIPTLAKSDLNRSRSSGAMVVISTEILSLIVGGSVFDSTSLEESDGPIVAATISAIICCNLWAEKGEGDRTRPYRYMEFSWILQDSSIRNLEKEENKMFAELPLNFILFKKDTSTADFS